MRGIGGLSARRQPSQPPRRSGTLQSVVSGRRRDLRYVLLVVGPALQTAAFGAALVVLVADVRRNRAGDRRARSLIALLDNDYWSWRAPAAMGTAFAVRAALNAGSRAWGVLVVTLFLAAVMLVSATHRWNRPHSA